MPQGPARFLTVKDVAARLQVATKTVLLWISEGLLPAVRVRKVYRIDPADLEEFCRRLKRKPPDSEPSP